MLVGVGQVDCSTQEGDLRAVAPDLAQAGVENGALPPVWGGKACMRSEGGNIDMRRPFSCSLPPRSLSYVKSISKHASRFSLTEGCFQ